MPAAHSQPIICYVTDRRTVETSPSIPNLLAKIRGAIAAGVDWVQIREKDLGARELLGLTRGAIAMAREDRDGAGVLLNDRLDVAIATGASGVHLGRDSAPARDVVRWLCAGNAPSDFRVGVSCHSFEEARKATDDGANYVFFGPVFDSPSKRAFGSPQGIARLGEVCDGVKIPVLAIGGVTEENAEECLRAGAAGIAAIRLFQQDEPATGSLKETIARLHQFG